MMGNYSKTRKWDFIRIIFGYLYFMLHLGLAFFMAVYIYLSIVTKSYAWESLFFIVPVLGMLAGLSIKDQRWNPWRVTALVISLVWLAGIVCLLLLLPMILT